MRQRIGIAFGGAGAAALVALFLWGGIAANPASAMEKMAEKIRQAKSLKVKMSMENKFVREPGKPPITSTSVQTLYWLAPKSYRSELTGGPHTSGWDTTIIFPADKPGIHIDNKTKTFQRRPARLGAAPPGIMFDQLGTFSGQADRKLGDKDIKGVKSRGFEIDGKKIDPDASAGPVEIWLDAESNLPVFISYKMKISGMPLTITMEDFQWNIGLDPKLFVAEPPAGYVEDKKSLAVEYPGPEKVLQGLKLGLQTYAELCGGHYPRITRTFAEPVRDEMLEAAGITLPATAEQMLNNKKYRKAFDGFQGLALFNRVLMANPDAAYYGKTVGPKDKDKVLVRWKLDDGRYQVVYGDLRAEIVTSERLRELEGHQGE